MEETEYSEEEESQENKKENLIDFGKLNKYYLIPFIAPLLGVSGNISLYYFEVKGDNADNIKGISFILIFIIFLSYAMGGLLYFISSIRSQTEKTRYKAKIDKGKKSLKLIYIKKEINKSKVKIFIYILIISIFITSSYIRDVYYSNTYEFEERLYFLFFVPILCKIILKKGIFRHQFLSLIISFLGLIIIFIPFFIDLIKSDDEPIKHIIISNILTIIESLFFSFHIVLVKYIIHDYYLSPFLCLLLNGIMSLIIIILGFIITSIIDNNNIFLDALNVLKELKFKNYIHLLFILIIGSLYHTFTYLIIYYFSPILFCMSDIISPMLFMIFETFIVDKNVNKFDVSMKSSGYILVLFATLIYNEIIILNFCGFNKYTSKHIKQRGNEELYSLRNTENETQVGEKSFTTNEEEKVNE